MDSQTGFRNISRSASSTSLPPRRSTSTPDPSPAEKEKAALITVACQDADLNAVIRLATSTHGLISDKLRRAVWPLLLGCDTHSESEKQTPWKELPTHREETQVALDVNRSFVYYPRNESEKQLDRRKQELSDIIVELLRRHPSLCYFQGYHDIVQVFLLVLGAQDAPSAVARLSLLRIRDFMLSSLDPAVAHLELLHPILATADPALYHHLPKSQPSFALAGTITMFAHNIQNYNDIARLFDFFLAHHTAMPIYFFAAVVLSRREEMLDIDKEDEDIMHAVLGRLPEPFDVEFHIARSVELFERLPPITLPGWAWWRISSSSVLKTSSTPAQIRSMTLEDGEGLVVQQEKEVHRMQVMKKIIMKAKYMRRRAWYYRRYGAVGLAVFVGAYALWLGRSRDSYSSFPVFGYLLNLSKRLLGRLP